MARLIVVEGEASHAQVSFSQACLIGRGTPCDLLLHDATASRTHARIERGTDGRYSLTDLDSANGTHLNDQAVTRSLLFDGDEIQIGSTRMRFLATTEGTILHDTGWVVRRRTPLLELETGLPERAARHLPAWQAVVHEILGVLDEESLLQRFLSALRAHLPALFAGFVAEDATGRRHEEITVPRREGILLPSMLEEVERQDDVLLLQDSRGQERAAFDALLLTPVRESERRRLGILYVACANEIAREATTLDALGSLAVCFARQLVAARDVRRTRDEVARQRLLRNPAAWVSDSHAFRTTLAELEPHAKRDTPLFLIGEAGTGRERLARWLHDQDADGMRPFHTLLCTPLEDDLLERELVGQERATPRGSFPLIEGLLARVGTGTLYLDSLGTRSRGFQQHLAEMLSERRFHPVGTDLTRRHHARLIIALEARTLESGLATLDPALQRIAQPFAVFVPPLRQRREDIPKLARRALARLRHEANVAPRGFTEPALDGLTRHDWPGNLRELRTVVELAALRATSERIDVDDLALP